MRRQGWRWLRVGARASACPCAAGHIRPRATRPLATMQHIRRLHDAARRCSATQGKAFAAPGSALAEVRGLREELFAARREQGALEAREADLRRELAALRRQVRPGPWGLAWVGGGNSRHFLSQSSCRMLHPDLDTSWMCRQQRLGVVLLGTTGCVRSTARPLPPLKPARGPAPRPDGRRHARGACISAARGGRGRAARGGAGARVARGPRQLGCATIWKGAVWRLCVCFGACCCLPLAAGTLGRRERPETKA